MTHAPHTPHAPLLRLVGEGVRRPVRGTGPQGGEVATGQAAARVEEANIAAASMSALDARWVLAVQAERALEGGRAAILTPDERRRLLLLGERVGLRPFDVSLVVAIVQDAARAGEDPLGRMAVDRLRLVRPGDDDALIRSGAGGQVRWSAVIAAMLLFAGFLAFAILRWVIG